MEETKQPVVIGLGRGYNGFYCPEAKFHLIGGLRPQAAYPSAVLSEDVKRGIRSGSLIDVNRVLSDDDIKPGATFAAHVTSGDRKKQIQIQTEEDTKLVDPDTQSEQEKLEKQSGEFLSETDVATNTGKVLFAYIEKTEGLSLELLGLTKSSTVGDVRAALNKHFGYAQTEDQSQED